MPMQPYEKYRPKPSFRVLCPTHPHGTDPSNPNPAANPPLKRSTMEFGHWDAGRANKIGRMAGDPGTQVATVTVVYQPANQVIPAGGSLLRIAGYEVRPYVDWVPVDNDAVNSAIALAAAISNLPGYHAVSLGGGAIEITRRNNQLDRIPIEVVNTGDFSHLELTTSDRGLLVRVDSTGATRYQTPDIT